MVQRQAYPSDLVDLDPVATRWELVEIEFYPRLARWPVELKRCGEELVVL